MGRDLPVIVDWVSVEPETGHESVRIEARIELINDQPAIVEMAFTALDGLDPVALQNDFRWASPLEAVTGIMPRLLAAGEDPYCVEPGSAGPRTRRPHRLRPGSVHH